MSLLQQQMAERRARILAAARKLIVPHGYDGLTMRDLARAARVSVPTLYNLFGSKDAILVAELERSAATVAERMVSGNTCFARSMAGFDTGMEMIAEAPEFHRAVMRMAITSPESAPMRRRGRLQPALMAGNLAAASARGSNRGPTGDRRAPPIRQYLLPYGVWVARSGCSAPPRCRRIYLIVAALTVRRRRRRRSS
jgi:AcrR family transcriptional regulator